MNLDQLCLCQRIWFREKSRYSIPIFSQGQHESPLDLHVANCKDQTPETQLIVKNVLEIHFHLFVKH